MLKKSDGYVMIYVMIVMLILGLVAGNALAAASHNATSEVNAVRQMKERYKIEGELNKILSVVDHIERDYSTDLLAIDHSNSFTVSETESIGTKAIPYLEKLIKEELKDQLGITIADDVFDIPLTIDMDRPQVTFEIALPSESTTIKATVKAVGTVGSRFPEYLDIGDDGHIIEEERFFVKSVECSIESFEITQS